MNKYAIAWTEFFDNNIEVEFYEAESEFDAAKECWKAHRFVGVTDTNYLSVLKGVFESFDTIEDIQKDFFDCDENISKPHLIES